MWLLYGREDTLLLRQHLSDKRLVVTSPGWFLGWICMLGTGPLEKSNDSLKTVLVVRALLKLPVAARIPPHRVISR
jgi:hypothetical protein